MTERPLVARFCAAAIAATVAACCCATKRPLMRVGGFGGPPAIEGRADKNGSISQIAAAKIEEERCETSRAPGGIFISVLDIFMI